ncbi:MAG TPA: Hpt domain-containing protein, partial [Rhodanobacteraceae bacterium]|nr:Hpt domain-containing protein [Rhodanobacteraceae bacterium]
DEQSPDSLNESLRFPAAADDAANDLGLPTIELPEHEAPVHFEDTAIPGTDDADVVPELSSAVDIMPGGDLGDLVIGETRSVEASSAHDTGLRFVDEGHADEADSDDRDASAGWIEIDEQVEERIPQQGVVDTGFSTSGLGDIDDDIRAVFIEEVEEEFERMRHQFHDWKADVDDFDNLKPLRRSFHTLKGSGRLVGAVVLGEFSWKVENLLNRVLDRAVTPGPAVQALIAHAIDALPELLKALRGGTSQANVAGITTTADRLAAGEEAWVPEFVPATRTVYHKVRRRVPVADTGDTGIPDVAPTHGDAGTPGAGAGPGLLADIDPVLFDILKTEVAGHLATVGAYLDECSPEPLLPTEPALRAVHTLTGAIAMVDIPTIAEVLAPLEGYFKRLRAASQPPLAAGVALIGEALALVRDVMTGLESGAGELPDAGPLAARIATLRDGLPEPAMSLESLIVIGDEPALLDQHTSVPADLEAAVADQEPAQDAESDAHEQEADQGQEADRQQEVAAAGDDVPGESAEVLPACTFAEPMPSSAADPSPTGQEADGVDEFISPATVVASATTHALDDALAAADSRPEPVSIPDTPVVDAPSEATSGPPASLPQERFELPDLDEDLLEIFVQEGADILDHSDGLMAGLRDAPGERATLAGLQRDLHTLKGGSRMVGLAPIGDLVHAMESLLEAIDEGRREMNQASIELLERGFDQLHELMQQVTQHQAIEMPVRTIARLAMLVEGRAAPPDEAAAVPAGATGPAGADDATAAPGASPPAARQMPTLDEEEVARAPQEMIRVRSDLLDSLVNYAGEVSIYRSRLEQQISGFRFNLVEFEQTVSRLREQLRKLEIETEAQIIARFQREHQEGLASFDPLELDRFSQLQQYSRALGESVSDLVSIQGLLDDITRQSETLLLQQSRVSSDLQEGLMRTRMVPFDSLVPSLRRTLRQAAQELGKQAQLKVEGAQGEMDRNLLERMKAPFEHMLRNALAHGIEAPADRLAAGKPPEGSVNIAVSRDATEVVLRVSDDGRGMDRDAIRSKAIERGLLKPEVQLSDRDLYGFVLETGFSTLDEVTQLAGRGVGMDVVHNEIKQLGGSLRIDSEAGRGTAFTLRLPFTLAVTQAILVKLGESVHAIPMSSVAGVVRMERADFVRRLASNSPTYEYAGESFTLYELSQLLGVAGGSNLDETQVPVLMTRTGDQRAGVCIDAVVGSREIVVKSVGPQISSVPGIFGATIMGDGSVVMILDLAPLVRRTIALRARAAGGEVMDLPRGPVAPAVPVRRRQPLIMVVDDSITMRKVTTRVLERAEMDVVTAKDGLDAVEKLQEKIPDLMLLDIEMPRMDGYELATYMKNDSRLKHVPIIMITSRTGEKHRQRALEIGVERYLGKPYQETDLVQNVRETLESVGAQA